MRLLLSHNYYRSSAPSGEDAVYQNERAMLEKHHDIIVYERHNDDIDVSSLSKRIKVALEGGWSQRSYDELSRLIRKHRPQLAHFHNTFPQISPSAYFACRDNNVPVVQTVHNYRFICPNALLMRNGAPCEDCVGKNLIPALYYRCYRDSLLATTAQVWTLASNRARGTYRKLVDRYIALTEFAAGRLIAGGLPADRMRVKPNFLPYVPLTDSGGDGGYAIYVGRMSEEKGVRTLLSAWREIADLPLKLVGDGPLRDEVVSLISNSELPITWLGYQSRETIIDLVRAACMLVVPSQWYEPFGMVVLEAYACGTPVVASDIGSLREIVREGVTGFKFAPGNAAALAQAVNAARCNDDTLRGMRAAARKTFEENFTEDVNYRQLLAVYEDALGSAEHGTRV